MQDSQYSHRPRYPYLWLFIGLLWGGWALRACNIMRLPVFVDESLHILRAQMVFDFNDPTASFLPGKLLLYYFLGLFQPHDVGGAWLSRQAVALLSLLGMALSYRLAITLTRQIRVGLLTLLFYAFTPFLFFFERMALADTFTMIWGLLLAISAVNFARHPNRRWAVWSGLALGLCLLAKLTALPWVIIPPMAIWALGRWTPSLKMHLAVLYGVMVLLLALPLAYIVYQEIAPIGEKQEVVTTTLYVPEEQTRLDQIVTNIQRYTEAIVIMFTPPLALLILIMAGWQLWHTPKATLYLLSITLAAWGFVVVTSARPSTRYLVVGVPTLLIITASGADSIFKQFTLGSSRSSVWKVRGAYILFGLLVTAAGWQSISFIKSAWHEPESLQLAERDTWEYFQNATTGYAYHDAAQDLPYLPALHEDGTIPVVGFVAACHTLRLYLPAGSHVEVTCPYFKWRLEFADQTLHEWATKLEQAREWYFLSDDEQPLDLSRLPAQWQLLATYSRPHRGVTTRLYHVTYESTDN